MPVYEFRNTETQEIREEFFARWSDAPPQIFERGAWWVRVPSAPRVRVDTPLDGKLRELEARGVVPLERGMDRDVKANAARRDKQEAAKRRELIAETVRAF